MLFSTSIFLSPDAMAKGYQMLLDMLEQKYTSRRNQQYYITTGRRGSCIQVMQELCRHLSKNKDVLKFSDGLLLLCSLFSKKVAAYRMSPTSWIRKNHCHDNRHQGMKVCGLMRKFVQQFNSCLVLNNMISNFPKLFVKVWSCFICYVFKDEFSPDLS